LSVPAPDDGRRALRWSVYWLLIVLSAGSMTGRLLAVNSVDLIGIETYLRSQGRQDWQRQRPFLSANDRSRWATIRALVEHGTYQIDKVLAEPNWDTIDLVKHDDQGREAPAPDEGHLYSSKPPLLATAMAGQYWLIHRLTGATLGTHPFAIGRAMLFTWQVVPLVIYFLMLAQWIERHGRTDWGRIFVMACATFGTFLTTFSVTLNNHIPAAVCALVAMLAGLRIWKDGERRLRYFVLAGLGAALAAANELPATGLLGLLGLALLWKAPRETLLAGVPSVLLVVGAYFGTNYLAHHSLRPPYLHRDEGDNWYAYEYVKQGRVRKSYWLPDAQRSPIDRGEPSRRVYAFHVLIGHHGIFSLTPVWLLTAAGLALACLRPERWWRELGLFVGLLSLICIAFYLARPLADRNYGGMTSGFRWVFWFAPLWLMTMLPAADAAADRRPLRGLCLALLAFSVLSASYPTWNPWTHPWIMDAMQWLGWMRI